MQRMMDKAEIAAQLRNMTEERLFGDKPWPIDNNAAVHQQMLDWGLVKKIDDTGSYTTTALGRELSVDYWTAFMGHHELSEIPDILAEMRMITRDEADHIIFDRWERDGEKVENILPPILRRLFRAQPQ